MNTPGRAGRWAMRLAGMLLALACCDGSRASAATVTLKDGRRLQGAVGKVRGLVDIPSLNKSSEPETIAFVDDELRRVFFPTAMVRPGGFDEADRGEVTERIAIRQNVARSGGKVNRVGPIVAITPFDERGRRTLTMSTDKGRLDVVQGITLITPIWTKVEGLTTQSRTPLIWDMRIATSSIPRETLHAILTNSVAGDKVDQRLRVVRLLLQAERFQDAQKELEEVLEDFPDRKDLGRQVQALRQLHARSIVKEIEVRRKSGQHILAYGLLEKFPTQDVAGEILAQVREMLEQYQQQVKQVEQVLTELAEHAASIKDTPRRRECEALVKEMRQELNLNTLPRMAAYLQFDDDASLDREQKLALAFSGWLLGGNQAERNLSVTLSLAKIRGLIYEYLNEPQKLKRGQIFDVLRGQEGASPLYVSKLIENMKPPLASPDPSVGKPGFFELQVPIGIADEPDVTYYVQLPPQYDPHVRYPTIVTLNGEGTTPEQQIDWWAGVDNAGKRLGQASRLGYIVISVAWMKEGQKEYEFSAREHASVLGSLRDACRRFSIDTDRVFLSGHSIGGDAAWDLGLAHPDLWNGVIPIVAQSKKYCNLYWKNAGLVPFYVVCGEKDGDKLKENARDLDRYMTKRFDITVTEYQGRGHEDFYEDIQHIFDWMGRREPRNFFPKQFTVSTMREWDNYFWWLEAGKFPQRGIVDPVNWPPARNVRPVEITGKVLATNGVAITSAASKMTVWLSPEVVDFNRNMKVTLNENAILKTPRVTPDLSVLLEDVRTRADRFHPFWAKVE